MILTDADLAQFAAGAYTTEPTWTGPGHDQSIHAVRSQIGKACVYAVRGSKDPNDWARDFSLLPWNLHELITDVHMIRRIGIGHAGIFNATYGIYEPVRQAISQDLVNGFEVYVTGHSLGGGITLDILRLLLTEATPVHITKAVTFAAPRVMMDGGREILGLVSINQYEYGSDPVPRTPPFFINPTPMIEIGEFRLNALSCHFMAGYLQAVTAYVAQGAKALVGAS